MCPLWWKSSSKLQGMYGLQGPTKENIPISPLETVHSCTNQANLTHGVTYAQLNKILMLPQIYSKSHK
jgi:hypothetical protein